LKRGLNISGSADLNGKKPSPQRLGGVFCAPPKKASSLSTNIHQHASQFTSRQQLEAEFQLLPDEGFPAAHYARDIPFWSSLARCKAEADRVKRYGGDNRDTGRRLSRCESGCGVADHDDARFEPNQLIHECGYSRQIAGGISILDIVVSAFEGAQFLQAL